MSSQAVLGPFLLRQDTRISGVLQLLNANPQLRSRDLANILEMSTSHLEHLFKSQVGMSVGQYAEKVRLQRANELLEKTIKEISETVGFPNASNFARAVERRFLVPTSRLRRQRA